MKRRRWQWGGGIGWRGLILLAMGLGWVGWGEMEGVYGREWESPGPAPGDRVVMVGDSITQAGGYVARVESWLWAEAARRGASRPAQVFNRGLSSETLSNTSEADHHPRRPYLYDRFERDVTGWKPNQVVACYGMNDGIYHPIDPTRLDLYRDGLERLARRVAALSEPAATLTLLTNPPFDARRARVWEPESPRFGYRFPYVGYDAVLRRQADLVRAFDPRLSPEEENSDPASPTSRRPRARVGDPHRVLNAYLADRQRRHASAFLAGDGVHPGPDGHALIALTLWSQGWGRSTLETPLRAAVRFEPGADDGGDQPGPDLRTTKRDDAWDALAREGPGGYGFIVAVPPPLTLGEGVEPDLAAWAARALNGGQPWERQPLVLTGLPPDREWILWAAGDDPEGEPAWFEVGWGNSDQFAHGGFDLVDPEHAARHPLASEASDLDRAMTARRARLDAAWRERREQGPPGPDALDADWDAEARSLYARFRPRPLRFRLTPCPPGDGQAANASPSHPRPNFLIILADDLRPDAVRALAGSGPGTLASTPHLDRLANSGVVLDRVYNLGGDIPAVCLPSRAMLLSGRAMFRHTAEHWAEGPSLAGHFREQGYLTYHHGKKGNTPLPLQARFEIERYIEEHQSRLSGRPAVEIADAAVEFLEHRAALPPDQRRPFLMHLALECPHDPLAPDPADLAALPPIEAFPLPPSFLPFHPFDNGEMLVRDERLEAFPRDPQAIRTRWRDYLAVVAGIDRVVGRLLEALTVAGERDNTYVIFTSDQGLALGDHGLLGKQNLYEHSIRVPFIVAGPGLRPGRCAAMVWLLDLFPTLCDLAGLKPPSQPLDGVSFAPALRRPYDPSAHPRQFLWFAYRDKQRAATDGRFKLIRYPKIHRTQLFDLSADPFEQHDLAGDPAQAERIAQLTAWLEAARSAWGDDAPFSAPQAAPEKFAPPTTPQLPPARP